jgi:hypothetical protein
MPMTNPMATTDVNRTEPARVSPELALVDADLAHRLRRRVPTTLRWKRPPLPVLRHAAVAHGGDSELEPGLR